MSRFEKKKKSNPRRQTWDGDAHSHSHYSTLSLSVAQVQQHMKTKISTSSRRQEQQRRGWKDWNTVGKPSPFTSYNVYFRPITGLLHRGYRSQTPVLHHMSFPCHEFCYPWQQVFSHPSTHWTRLIVFNRTHTRQAPIPSCFHSIHGAWILGYSILVPQKALSISSPVSFYFAYLTKI